MRLREDVYRGRRVDTRGRLFFYSLSYTSQHTTRDLCHVHTSPQSESPRHRAGTLGPSRSLISPGPCTVRRANVERTAVLRSRAQPPEGPPRGSLRLSRPRTPCVLFAPATPACPMARSASRRAHNTQDARTLHAPWPHLSRTRRMAKLTSRHAEPMMPPPTDPAHHHPCRVRSS